MFQRNDLYASGYLMRSIRNRDKEVIFTVFVIMVGMLPVIKTLWFVDLFILNMTHAIDLFFDLKDWKKCSKDLCFGWMYLLATRCENIFLTLFCGSAVVTVWIETHRTDGYPCIAWIFFPCLLIWALKFSIKWAPDAIVSLAVFKTTCLFMFNYPNKTLEDSLLVFSILTLHLVFAQKDYNAQYIAISNALSFAWMYLKY